MQTILEMPELGSRTDLSDNDVLFGSPAERGPAPASQNSFVSPGKRSHNHALIEAMVNSKIYHDCEKAFSEATGLPLALRPADARPLPRDGKRSQNPVCATEVCDTAVPVRLGDQLIGFLQTGQLHREKSSVSPFDRAAKLDCDELDQTFFDTKVVSNKQHESVVKLLTIFAEHLSLLSNQVVVRPENSEPPVIVRAKEYIHKHHTEDISLGQVAKAVNTSTFYFCKMFKKVTGINFTDYLSRLRIEKSKSLLLDRNLRVSEIAFEVGFQSLTHFNRVFKKLLGQSPTEYRAQLLGN
jgi:AraC-like DNA-binding protein